MQLLASFLACWATLTIVIAMLTGTSAHKDFGKFAPSSYLCAVKNGYIQDQPCMDQSPSEGVLQERKDFLCSECIDRDMPAPSWA